MKTFLIFLGIAIVIGVLIWGFGTGWGKHKFYSSTSTSTTTPSSSTTTPSSGNSVTIQNFAFNPASLTVTKGTQVTWTNNDSTNHTITSDSGAFASDQVAPGGTFSFTFNDAGTFPYHCSIHTSMKATVIVQ
jgi:plastocyanin